MTYNYSYTGSLQAYTAPSDGSVTSIYITLAGGQGGNGASGAGDYSIGAQGGITTGYLLVTPGQTYYIIVGGQGAIGTTVESANNPGNWGGSGGGGGGKSFITTTNNFVMDASVLLVAAGGGGGGSSAPYVTFQTIAGGAGGWPNGGAGGSLGGNGGPGGGGGGDGYYGGYGAGTSSSLPPLATQTSGYAYGAGGPGPNGYYVNGSGQFAGAGGGVSGGSGSNGYGGGRPALAGGGGGGSSYASSSIYGATLTQGGNAGNGYAIIQEIPLITLSTFDAEIITDYVQTSGPLKIIPVSDTEIISEFASLARNRFSTDTPIQIGTSSYKWLTQTLYDAQNKYVVQPNISCQVVDETLLVNQQMYNIPSTSTTAGFSGDSVMAPDGNILAIGSDPTGSLRFAKITGGTQISQWDQILLGTGGTVLASPGSGNWEWNNPNFGTYNGFHLNASIAVSDYINETYVIDIYWWYNDGTYFQAKRARSIDGGNTFIIYTDISFANIPNSSTTFLQIQAGKPVFIPSTGTISAAAFILVGSGLAFSNSIFYNYTNDGTSYSGGLGWVGWGNFIPHYISNDFILHSFDVEYINGEYYVVFAGYHSVMAATNPAPSITSLTTQQSFFGNFGLYLTKLVQPTEGNYSDAPPSLFFTEPKEILVFNSSSPTNMNQILYPSLNYDGKYLWLNYRLDNTTSVSESTQTTTSTTYYLNRSADFKNFDYPTIILDVNGNSIVNPAYYNGVNKYAFVGNQNGYYYFWGDGALWQFAQNNISADVSSDIIGIQIEDQSGGASSINLTIANTNGKWAGPTPTGINYQAIWKNGLANKNSKIYLKLGYQTASGTGETVPRNIFYIDDITQNISATQNDLVLSGRDWNKLLSVTQTAFTYNFNGPDFYNDSFNNTTIANWNQTNGTWVQITPQNNSQANIIPTNLFVPYTTYTNTSTGSNTPLYSTSLTAQTLAVLSGYTITHPEITMSCAFYLPNTQLTGNYIDFYPWYLNSNNYIRVSITQSGSGGTGLTNTQIHCEQCSNGVTTTTTPGSYVAVSNSAWYNIYIRLYNFGNNVDILWGQSDHYGNGLSNFIYEPTSYQGQVFNWTLNPGSPYNTHYNNPGQLATIAIGTRGTWGTDSGSNILPTIWTGFYNLKFMQNTYSQTIQELTESLGTLGHIFDYLPEQDYVQDLYDPTQWNTSSLSVAFPNRTLQLNGSSYALQNTQQYTDGQIEFDAQINIPSTSENFGFDFVLRSQSGSSLSNCYKIRIMNASNNGTGYLVKASLLNSYSGSEGGVDLPLYSTIIPDNLPSASYSGTMNLNIDLTQWNHYSIAFNGGWIYLFINSIEVLAWYDNNFTQTFSTGYWGFSSVNTGASYDYAFNSNQSVIIKNITFPTFWNQINAFVLNPGDDLTSAITTNLQTIYGWFFSDLGGRMKIITLRDSDAVSYYYGNGATNYLLYSTSNDSSDKEYYNSILVVGDGVSYLATDNTSIGSNGILREEVIVDYKITTITDAQTRAEQELINIKKYGAQPAPMLNINVGSEIFDVVNIKDTSAPNASNLNGNYRMYTENFNIDNKSNYSLTLGAGNISS